MAWYDSIGKMAKGVADFTGVTGLWHDLSTSMSNSDPWYVDALNLGKDVAKVGSTPVRAAVKGVLAAGQESYKVGGYARQWMEQGILDTPLMYNKFKNDGETFDQYKQRVAQNKDQISLGEAALSVLSPGKNADHTNGWLANWEDNNAKFLSAGFDLFNPDDRAAAFKQEALGKFISGTSDLAASTLIDPLTFTGFLGKGAVIASKGTMLENISGKATRAVFGKAAMTTDKFGSILTDAIKGEGPGVKTVDFLANTDAKGQYSYWAKQKVSNPDAMSQIFGAAKTRDQVVETFKAVMLKDPQAQAAVFNRAPGDALAIESLNDVPHPLRQKMLGNLDGDALTAELSPDYTQAVGSYIADMAANDERYAAALKQTMGGNELYYGVGRGPLGNFLTNRTIAGAEKANQMAFGDPSVQFFQKSSLHPIIKLVQPVAQPTSEFGAKVKNFFTAEVPSGKYNVNDSNAYGEFNAMLTEVNQLSKGTFAESSRGWADKFLNAVSPGEKMSIIKMTEQDAMSHLFPDMDQKDIDKLYAIFDSRRAKKIQQMKDQGFISTVEGDQVIHNVDQPILQSESANTVITPDFRKLKTAIDAHQAILPSLLSGLDIQAGMLRGKNALQSLDTINDIFKTSVLLRLGYTIRNVSEAQLSMAAKGFALPAMAAAGGKATVARFFNNRKVGFDRLADNVNVMLGRKEDLGAMQTEFAHSSDQLRALDKTRNDAIKEITKRITENTGVDTAATARLKATIGDLSSTALYHGSPEETLVPDPSRPLALSGSKTVARRYLPNNQGTVHQVRVYGSELNMTNWNTMPKDLREELFQNSRANYTNWYRNKGWQNPNDSVVKYLKDNNYGHMRVTDDAQAGGVSHIALPEYIGAKGKQTVISKGLDKILAENTPMGPVNIEPALMNSKERRQANRIADKYRRIGFRDKPVSPYYSEDSLNAMLNNGVEDFARNLMTQVQQYSAHLDDMAGRIGAGIDRAESTSVKQRLGYGYNEIDANGHTYKLPKVFQNASWFLGRTSSEATWNSMVAAPEMAFSTGMGARTVRTIKPGDPKYFEGWANILNMHFRNPETGEMDPVVRQILDGKSDSQLLRWFKTDEQGKLYANDVYTRVGKGINFTDLKGGEYDEYLLEKIAQTRGSVKLYIPDEQTALALSAAKDDERVLTGGDIQKFLIDRFGKRTDLPTINGLLVPTSREYKDQERIIDTVNRSVMRFLGSLPEDTFARHPLAQVAYERKLRQGVAAWAAAKGSETLTADELNNIVRSSREFARQEVERTLFTIVRRTGASSSTIMKLMFPFYGAYENTIKRWSGFLSDDPSIATTAARSIAQIVNSQQVVDQNGNIIKDANKLAGGTNANLVVRVPQGFINSLPSGWRDVVNNAFKQIHIPLSSLDVVTQGQPGNPGFGPFAVLPAYLILQQRPELEQAFKPLFPAGQPESAFDLFTPSVVRRLKSMWTQDALYVRTYDQMLRYETYNYNTGARTTQPTASEIADKTNKFFLLRALSSVTLPITVSPETDFYATQYRKFQQLYTKPGEADAKFLEVYPDYFAATISLSKNVSNLEPSIGTVQNLKKFKDLMAYAEGQGDPELMGFLANDGDGKYTFSQAAYQWQYSHGATPGAANTYRQNRPAQELVRDANIKQGWTNYGKLMDQIGVYQTQNGITSSKDPQMKAINGAKSIWVQQMAKTNPDWYAAYISPDRSKYMRRADILSKALQDKKWMAQNGNRPVVKSVALYLDTRNQIANILDQRKAQGGSKDLNANTNGDLAYAFEYMRQQLSLQSPEFSQFINRYFPNDTVVV